MIEMIKNWLSYWFNFFNGIVSDDTYDVESSNTPIYDRLEREWANRI